MKTLALIDDNMYFRNFVKSGAFSELTKNSDFKISLAQQVFMEDKKIPKNKFYGRYQRMDDNKKVIFTYNKIAMFHLRKKSATFEIKAKNYQYDIKNFLVYNLFSLPIFFPLAKRIILNKLKPNRSLEKLIRNFKPGLVILPLTGTESTSYELILLSRKYHFKTLFLMNGWDNLSSKTTFLLKPDYLGVWGPQQLEDAITIQGMESERCFLLGCARYEDYFTKRNIPRIFPFKYIVFAGTQTAHEEIRPLKIFDKALTDLKIKDIKIIYRPHPNREKRLGDDIFRPAEFKYTIIDPQVAPDYFGNKKMGQEASTSQNFPELDYNTSLLKHALFIISPLSSLILESAIFDVPSLIPANTDDPNPISPGDHAGWKHFRGADQVPGWFVARDYQQIEEMFKKMVKQFKDDSTDNRIYKGVLSSAIKKYLFFDNRSYSQRLAEAVKIILQEPNHS